MRKNYLYKKHIKRKVNASKTLFVMLALLMSATMTACTSGETADNTIVYDVDAKTDGSSADTSDYDNELFTDRDLNQTPELSDAEELTLVSGEDLNITKEGIYILSGSVQNVTVYIDTENDAKVQLILDGAEISNDDMPCIYVKNADKVFVTTTDTENTLSVTGSFTADGDTNLDAVIFSKDDLVINGQGTLNISSSDNAISCKDTLKITGSTINIECSGNALEAHDAINIADGTINITSCNDGLHAKNSDDDSTGSIYIGGGTFNITANDDAIHGTTLIQIEDGEFDLTGRECIEGTYIKVNGGNININASDDGINAAAKSTSYTPTFEMNGGKITIVMAQGDTDGIDSNSDIYINGGTLDISGQSTFDYDGTAEYNGGTIIENGTETNSISNQEFGPGGGMGDFGPGGNVGEFGSNGNTEDFVPGGNAEEFGPGRHRNENIPIPDQNQQFKNSDNTDSLEM